MRKILAFFLILIFFMFALPAGITVLSKYKNADNREIYEEGDAVTTGSFNDDLKISVYAKSEDKLMEIRLEDYLVGVLAGEMPPTYEREALKAQAIAARSYILGRVSEYLEGNIHESHNGAMVCTDYEHCKAWRDINEIKKTWDSRYSDDYEEKIRSAVESTKGEYMTYDNKVVKAYFYAISGGKTENVEDVWGVELPYLRSVSCFEDIGCDGYESMSSYPKDMFIKKLRMAKKDSNFDNFSLDIGRITKTDAGSIADIEIGGILFKGAEIREIFGLRSSNFDIHIKGDKITFVVRGYGHGVGMSQNGANVMAMNGKTCEEILKHFYTDVSIVNLYKKS
ncbi:MAG: stage II sporulation protein D [Clostridia bacterium]|nr:stage II sporulation protein D [Clostridia bacterium]